MDWTDFIDQRFKLEAIKDGVAPVCPQSLEICIFLIFVGSKKLKILKYSETAKSAFFSFWEEGDPKSWKSSILTHPNLHFFSHFGVAVGVQKVKNIKIFWNIQIFIFLKWGRGSKELKILKSSETSKSAFYSNGGSNKLKILKSSETSKSAFFPNGGSNISLWGSNIIFLGEGVQHISFCWGCQTYVKKYIYIWTPNTCPHRWMDIS